MPSVHDCSQVTDICKVEDSIYGYYPSLPANALFLAIFLSCTITQLYQGIRYKSWTFSIALVCGCLIEAIGYIGRVIMHGNPFSDLGFKMQICCLIMGPAFLAIGVYLTLKHLVKAYGREYSYLRPKYYTWLFIACDFLSLTLQAAGGGLASSANGKPQQMSIGNDLAIAGIIMQVITLGIFAALVATFFIRRHADQNRQPTDPTLQTKLFQCFLAAVAVAFTTIFVRCVYRIPEMIGGWGNPLMQNQKEFIVLDSTMCSIAAVVLTIFHPGWCFPQMIVPLSKEGQTEEKVTSESMSSFGYASRV